MQTNKVWELLPNSDFTKRSIWRDLGNNRYAALRARLLIVCTNGKQSRLGPAIAEYNVAPGVTITIKRRRERIISRTETISKAIRFVATSRVCDKLAAKISSELSAKLPGFSGKIQSEILAKSEYEISEEMENALTSTTSHFIQETEELEHVITLSGGKDQKIAQLRRRFWPRQWDVYLYSYDYLELSYRKSWLWGQVRATIKRAHSKILGWPLTCLIFYEPQSDVDVCYGPIQNEIENPELLEVNSLSTEMPPSRAPRLESLENLAKLAFQVKDWEKSRAAKKKAKATAAKKKTAKRTRAKKKIETRKAVKKTVTRKRR